MQSELEGTMEKKQEEETNSLAVWCFIFHCKLLCAPEFVQESALAENEREKEDELICRLVKLSNLFAPLRLWRAQSVYVLSLVNMRRKKREPRRIRRIQKKGSRSNRGGKRWRSRRKRAQSKWIQREYKKNAKIITRAFEEEQRRNFYMYGEKKNIDTCCVGCAFCLMRKRRRPCSPLIWINWVCLQLRLLYRSVGFLFPRKFFRIIFPFIFALGGVHSCNRFAM